MSPNMNVVPAHLTRARISKENALDRVIALEMQILVEEARATQQKREPNPDLINQLEAELAVARQNLANADSVLIGNEAKAKFPPLTRDEVAA